jgi:pimeloyl-ACP methyl ester carboxylesterase
MRQVVRFCTTADGVRIAYAVAGTGPLLVLVGSWVNASHLEDEAQPDSPFHGILERLAARHTLVRYDARGMGLSERRPQDHSLPGQTRDLAAVVDALRSRPVALLGVHLGGAVAIDYASQYPSRVSRLVLYATAARGASITDDRARESHRQLIRAHWGVASRAWAEWFAPSMANDRRFVARLARSIRMALDAESAVAVFNVQHSVDVSDCLSAVAAPTLVVHRTADRVIPVALGRELAAAIPNARLIPLPGDDDVPVRAEQADELVSIVEQFLSEPASKAVESAQSAAVPDLTARERDVLSLLALGRTNREIADELSVSVYTVNRHVSSVLAKLGASNRTEAAHRAAALELLDQP